MSRSRFLLRLGGGTPAGPDPGTRPGRAAGPAPRSRRTRRKGAAAAFPWWAFACPLAPGLGWAAAQALSERAALCGPARTVILDLAGSTGVGEDDCAALGWLHERLHGHGSRLWLAAAPRAVSEQFDENGLTGMLGAAAIHPSRRAAVLAAFAALPGPGLVTSPVREALTAEPEPLLPGLTLPDPARPALSPAQPAAGSAEPVPGSAEPARGSQTFAGPMGALPNPGWALPGPVHPLPDIVRALPGPVGALPNPGRALPGPVHPLPDPVRALPGPVHPLPGTVRALPGPVHPLPDPVRALPGRAAAGVAEPGAAEPGAEPGPTGSCPPERAWRQPRRLIQLLPGR